ncbi:MAG: threonylcarbamoyl-AMP synthase [Clostridiales bacterium]|nr:threonylcarbamoyl-AMP synthase [Clostridiales bacterium]
MKTIIKKVNGEKSDESIYAEAAQILKRGGLVAFPTETVYGLGGNGFDDRAAERIYMAKGRPSDNPLILHISNIETLYKIVDNVPIKAEKLIGKFWPGPLTIIFGKGKDVPYKTTGGLDTVAVRMPNHLVALSIIEASGLAIAAPSANISGRPSPTTADHVILDLKDKVDMIIDGGDVGIGLESTIVDVTDEIPVILRPGYITKNMLEEVVGEVLMDESLIAGVSEDMRPKAPGMKYRHYAPKAELTIVEGPLAKVTEKINQLAEEKMGNGYQVGIIATEETKDIYKGKLVQVIGSRNNELSIGKHLYGVLREFDRLGVNYIYSEAFSDEGFGQAIMNRLNKAAGYNVINL